MKNDKDSESPDSSGMTEKATQAKKALLLETAGELFAEHGFDGTSVRMIAEKSGMNVAMISYYFGSKEKLFEDLINAKINYMREQLGSLLENDQLDPWQKFEIVIEGYAKRIITSNGSFHKLMMREVSLGQRTEISKMIEEKMIFNMKAVHTIFMEGRDKKIFRDDLDFPMIMSTVIGTISQTIASNNMFCRFNEMEGKLLTDAVDPLEQSLRVQKHLKRVFASYMLIHPEHYNY